GRLTAVGVAQVGCDAAVLARELPDRVERAPQTADRRVQPAAGDQHQRKAGPGLLIVNPDWASSVELARAAGRGLLREDSRGGGDHGRCGAGLQDFAASRILEALPVSQSKPL